MKINVISFAAGMVSAMMVGALFTPLQASAEAAQTVPPQIPVRDFFKTPEQSSFSLSPDGKFLSYMKPWSESGAATRKNIFIQAIDASNSPVPICHGFCILQKLHR